MFSNKSTCLHFFLKGQAILPGLRVGRKGYLDPRADREEESASSTTPPNFHLGEQVQPTDP